MEKELISFIKANKLSPFSRTKTSIKKEAEVFKTKDSKEIFNKTLAKLSEHFCFAETSNLWSFFPFSDDFGDIKQRQDFFKSVSAGDNSFLDNLQTPKKWWKPKYGILAVTEDEKTFGELQKLDIPCKFLTSQYDVSDLENYDIVQVIECENFSGILEGLPQSVFIDSLDEVYLERYLELLSSWKSNIELLNNYESTNEIKELVAGVFPLLSLLEEKIFHNVSREDIEVSLNMINQEISEEIRKMSISGDVFFSMMSSGKIPKEFAEIIERSIKKTGLPEHLFSNSIPVALDEEEVEKLLKKQCVNEFTELAENVKKNSEKLKKVSGKLASQIHLYYI